MTLRIAASILLLGSLAFAKPATQPAARPATRPAAPVAAATTRPATQVAAKPNPLQNALRELDKHREQEAKQLKVAYIDLDQPLVERPPVFTILGDTSLSLHSVLDRLKQARQDKSVRAVLLNLGSTGFNLSQAQELRDALAELRKAGKRSFVYADTFDTSTYIAATGASDICMLEGGEIMIPGVGLETMFAKGLLDKVGVRADYVQIGQYKGADEQYTRTEPSKELRGELNKILDSLYEQIIDGIANYRNISRFDVQDVVNNVMISGRNAKDRKLVDHLVDQDGLRALLARELGREINLLEDYGKPHQDAPDFSNPLALLSTLAKKPEQTASKSQIALLYAEGVIVDGEGGEGLLGGGTIGSEDLRKALRIASRDENVKAIVLRIDSPGGSAMASEVIWQAARRAAQKKPLVISVGGMAASGGYYIASAGEYIFADPSAIVGSIGVVGGKFVFKDLFEKLGIHNESFSRGTNADLFTSNEPFTEPQRRLVTHWMQQTYQQFVDRILTTRKQKIKDIDEVAHGRIFAAKQARQMGMVDELGGIEKAIAYAAAQAKLEQGKYDVRLIPSTKSILDLLRGVDPETRSPIQPRVRIDINSPLRALPSASARLVAQQLEFARLLQQRPVILAAPYIITLK